MLQSYVLLDCADDAQKPSATLFVDASKVAEDLASELTSAGVTLAPYDDVEAAVRKAAADGVKILLDPKGLNYGLREAASANAVREDGDQCTGLRPRKMYPALNISPKTSI